jgi:hypothetical protein
LECEFLTHRWCIFQAETSLGFRNHIDNQPSAKMVRYIARLLKAPRFAPEEVALLSAAVVRHQQRQIQSPILRRTCSLAASLVFGAAIAAASAPPPPPPSLILELLVNAINTEKQKRVGDDGPQDEELDLG